MIDSITGIKAKVIVKASEFISKEAKSFVKMMELLGTEGKVSGAEKNVNQMTIDKIQENAD